MPGADLAAEGDGIHVRRVEVEPVAVVGGDEHRRPGPRREVGLEHAAQPEM